MEQKQIDILRHALGISERNPTGYRNRFSSGVGCDHYPDCCALRDAGYMVSRDSETFFVTEAGRLVATGGGEPKMSCKICGSEDKPTTACPQCGRMRCETCDMGKGMVCPDCEAAEDDDE